MTRAQFQSALRRAWSEGDRRALRAERLLRPFWVAAPPAAIARVVELSTARRRAR